MVAVSLTGVTEIEEDLRSELDKPHLSSGDILGAAGRKREASYGGMWGFSHLFWGLGNVYGHHLVTGEDEKR